MKNLNFKLFTDVEIQKTRKADKLNPAYSPDQSEPNSPGEFFEKICIIFKENCEGEKNCAKVQVALKCWKNINNESYAEWKNS